MTDDEERKAGLVRRCAAGEAASCLATESGIKADTIRRWVRRLGLPSKNGPTEAQRQTVIASFRPGDCARSVAERLGLPFERCAGILRAAGLSRPGARRVHALDEHYFDVIDTPAKARWLGFITADGNVMKPRANLRDPASYKTLTVGLNARDEQHLYALRSDLQHDGPINRRDKSLLGASHRGGTMSVYTAHSHALCSALVAHGVVPAKSLVIQPWSGPPDLMRHYFAGLADGDGWVCTTHGGRHWRIGLCGSLPVVQAFVDFANALTERRVSPRRSGSIWACDYGNRDAVRLLARAFYSDTAGGTPLARKAALASRLLAEESWPKTRLAS